MCPLEFGSVRPYVKLDADRRVVRGRLVILVQPSTHFSGLYANYRIISSCVSCMALKEVDSYCAFFEPLAIPLKTVMNHVRQKLLAALAQVKNGTVQDRIEFAKDRCFFKFIEDAVIAINFFVPTLICCRLQSTHSLLFESSCD